MHINSKDNPRVKLFRKLLSSKKAREEHGLFAVEGARNCVDTAYEAVCGRIKVHSVFYTQTALTKYKNTLKTDSLFSCARPEDIFEISDELAKKMKDEGNSQGIYMIVFKVDLPFVAEYILRTADAVGVSGVVMTDNCVDLYNPKVVRSAMGSTTRLDLFVVDSFLNVATLFDELGIVTNAAVVRNGENITEFDFDRPCAVVIGNEGKGLPKEHSDICKNRVTIGKCFEVAVMDKERLLLWIRAVLIFTPSSKRIWEVSANYDDIVEFMTALDDHMVSGLNDKELQRIGKYSLKDAEIIKKRCEELGINIYCYESEGYPDRLKRIANPPAVLYTYGNLDFLNDKCVISVVGSREPSEYSVKITKHICADLIRRNCLLASGFAGGIDQIANKVAIENNSRPIAVCGTALDCDYPKGSNELKKQIAENGVVISEYFPGYKPFGSAFVNRNRILTGLSNAVLFTECSKESHGLDNVNHAISQGKQVFVVPPHDIYDSRYFGQRDLIRNECQPVFGAEDIVYSLGNERYQSLRLVESLGEFTLPAEDSVSETEEVKPTPEPDLSGLDDTQKSICKLLKSGNMLVDDIAAKLGMDISDVLAQLTELELYGTVKSYPGKMFGL